MFTHEPGGAEGPNGPILAEEGIGEHAAASGKEGLEGILLFGGQVGDFSSEIGCTDGLVEALGGFAEGQAGKIDAPLLANDSQQGDVVLEQRDPERAHDNAATESEKSPNDRVNRQYQDYYTVFTPPSKHDILPLRQPNGLTGHAEGATIDGQWLRVRKALSPFIHLDMDENRQAELVGQLAERIQSWGLSGLVSVLLDALEPFAFVGGQLLWILQPTLGLLVDRDRIAEYAMMLERPEAYAQLRAQIKES